jgi:hypothetical protein
MKIAGKLLVVALCAAALSFGAIIDTFGTPQGPETDLSSVPGVFDSSTLGNRTIAADMTSGTGLVTVLVNGGIFYGAAGPNTMGTTSAFYTSLWDLTSPNVTTLRIEALDLEGYTGGTITFSIRDTANNIASLTVPAAGPGIIAANLSSFLNIQNVDRSNINNIGFTFNHVTAQDISLDNFEATNYIPEPSTYTLMGVGLLGIFALRRKTAR